MANYVDVIEHSDTVRFVRIPAWMGREDEPNMWDVQIRRCDNFWENVQAVSRGTVAKITGQDVPYYEVDKKVSVHRAG